MSEEIEKVYQDSNVDESILVDLDSHQISFDQILKVVQDLAKKIVGREIDPETDIFLQGCDRSGLPLLSFTISLPPFSASVFCCKMTECRRNVLIPTH